MGFDLFLTVSVTPAWHQRAVYIMPYASRIPPLTLSDAVEPIWRNTGAGPWLDRTGCLCVWLFTLPHQSFAQKLLRRADCDGFRWRERERNTCIIHRWGFYGVCVSACVWERPSLCVLLHKPSVTCQAARETQPAHCCSCCCFQASRVRTQTRTYTHAYMHTHNPLKNALRCFFSSSFLGVCRDTKLNKWAGIPLSVNWAEINMPSCCN